MLACLSAIPGIVQAQAAGSPPPPTGGTLLQQLQPTVPQVPPPGAAPPELVAPKAVTAPSSGAGPTMAVKGFRIQGLAAERAEALLPALQKYTGAGKTLADLEDAAKDVEVALQRQGLFLAQAYVPEQAVADGIVTIQVLPGRIGTVRIETQPGVRVAPEFMDRIVAILQGNPIADRALVERALFTLGDLRGITATSALTPGDKVGFADLTITVSPAPASASSVDVDNGGSVFTGRVRVNGGVEWFNLAARGDVASIKAQLTTNGGSQFVRAAWLTPVNERGTKLGVAASFLKYRLGDILESLDADGTASALSVQLLHPVVRSRNSNLFLAASADQRDFDDRVNAVPLRIKKSASGYFTLGVVGDFRDTLGGGGISNYSATVVGGRLRIKTEDELSLDQSVNGFRTNGNYAKVQFTGSRLQVLPNKDYLYLSASAQVADKNLDSSEKFSLGGITGVRAYPAPESPSDEGFIASWEYRKPLAIESIRGDWVLAIFGDYAVGRLHHRALDSDPTPNTRHLNGHGIGLTYANNSGLFAKAWIAVRGHTEAQSDDSRVRAYVQLGQQF